MQTWPVFVGLSEGETQVQDILKREPGLGPGDNIIAWSFLKEITGFLFLFISSDFGFLILKVVFAILFKIFSSQSACELITLMLWAGL